MCGFAGVIAWEDKYRTPRETLARMSAAVAHRGPDGEGSWFNHEGEVTSDRPQAALAFRRLAIIDLDPRANQPLTDGQGRWIVFNGEIYNYRELRKELSSLDPHYDWKTQGDTEVLLRSYAQWGETCVEHLNGMFAFAVWDEGKKELYLARDRMGQKPLYVGYIGADGSHPMPGTAWETDEGLAPPRAIVFASELGAAIAAGICDRELDESALTGYLQLGYISGDETIYRGFRQMPPAMRLVASARACTNRPYWPPANWPDANNGKTISDADAVRRSRELLVQAVRRQLVADVPLGCYLSGGIDSSTVAAAMKASAGGAQEILTFSIGFDDPRYDESHYARRVAEHLRTKHQSFVVRPNVVEDLPRLAAVFGEPFGDSSALPTHYLARETRKHAKVALSGDGGDELFGGYERYRAMALAARLRRVTTPVPWFLMKPVLSLIPGTHPKSALTRARRFLTSVGMPAERRYSTYMRLFDGDTIVQLFGPRMRIPQARSYGPTHNDSIYFQFGAPHWNSGRPRDRIRDQVRAAMAVDRVSYLPGDLLTKVDRASMLHALEVRSPFMDHELVQFAAGLTTDQLIKGGPKRMLREAFAKDLPDFVFKRKKMGFAVPIGEWMRNELRPMLHDHLFAADSFASAHFNRKVVERLVAEHQEERVDHSQRLYALLMLELWWRIDQGR